MIFLFIVFYIFLNLFNQKDIVLKNYLDVKEDLNEQEDTIKLDTIKVDIKGAVNNPGVYELKNNSRVGDVILISGGLTKDADTSVINLSKTLKDEMVIIIYTKKEISEMKKGSTSIKYIEKECVCPKIENDACIENLVTNEKNDTAQNVKNTKISLNTASMKELSTLSGIGESKAKAIIDYRNKNNGFKTIEEIKKVSGIGNSIYEKIKDNITI